MAARRPPDSSSISSVAIRGGFMPTEWLGVCIQVIDRLAAQLAWSSFDVGVWAECARLCTTMKLMNRFANWSRRTK